MANVSVISRTCHSDPNEQGSGAFARRICLSGVPSPEFLAPHLKQSYNERREVLDFCHSIRKQYYLVSHKSFILPTTKCAGAPPTIEKVFDGRTMTGDYSKP